MAASSKKRASGARASSAAAVTPPVTFKREDTDSSFDMGRQSIKFAEDAPARAPSPHRASSPPVSTPSSPLRSSQITRHHPSRQGRTFRGVLASLAFLYLGFSALVTCRFDSQREHGVCRAFDELTRERARAVDFVRGHAQPYLDRASAAAEPYIAPVRPHVERASKVARPIIRRAQRSYDATVPPATSRAYDHAERLTRPHRRVVHKHYLSQVDPHVQRYSKLSRNLYAANVDPHVQLLSTQASYAFARAQDAIMPTYERVLPAAQHAYAKMLLPAATSSYTTSRDVYHKHVYPGARTLGRATVRVWRTRVVPMLGRYYSLYIQPPLDRVRAKVFEHRARSAGSDAAVETKENVQRVREEEKMDDLDEFIADLKSTIIEYEEPNEATTPEPVESISPEEAKRREAVAQASADEAAAQLEQATREKRTKVERLLETYAADIEKLGAAESRLLIERLNSLRRAASVDIPARFDPRVTTITNDGDKMIAKLERHFERVARDLRTPVEQKVADADDLTLKALARLHSRADDTVDEIDTYGQTHWQKEANAVNGASSPLMDLVFSAQREVGDGLTWLADVQVKDWTRYHEFGDAEKRWLDHYRGMMNGTASDPSLIYPNPYEDLAELRAKVEAAATAFEERLEDIRDVGIKRLEGRFVSAGESVRNAAAVARGVVIGEKEPEAEGVAASASSLYARASEAVAASSSEPGLVERAASSLHQATRSASSAVGLQPTPEAIGEHVESVSSVVTDAVSAAQSRAADALRQAQDALGLDIDVGGLVGSATAAVTNAPSAASVVSDYVDGAVSSVSSVGSVASSAASDAIGRSSDLPSAVSSTVRSVARAASSAVSATPSPDGAVERMESLYAAASRAADSIANAASVTLSDATEGVKMAVGATPSPLTDRLSASAASFVIAASSSLSSATRAASQAVGATPSPEGVAEHVSSVTQAVRDRLEL